MRLSELITLLCSTSLGQNTSTLNYNPNDGPSDASVANLQVCLFEFLAQLTVLSRFQYFIDSFACQGK